MKTKHKLLIYGGVAVLIGLSFVPLFEDPFHEKGKVTFWEWLGKEVWELLHGEKEVAASEPTMFTERKWRRSKR